MLRLGVIGAGWAGQRQIRAASELPNRIKIIALADNDSEHLRATAATLGIATTYTRSDDLLADRQLDAVSICTPHALHRPMAIAAAEAGLHILVEKPMALTVADASDMISAAQQNHVKLYVAENWAYSPVTVFMREVVATGRFIGELIAASYAWGFRAQSYGYRGRRAWLGQPEQGGSGAWMLHGIHSVARLRHILGEARVVYLQEHHSSHFRTPNVEGTVSGLFTLESGVHLSILHSCELNLKGSAGGMLLHGDKGSIRAHEDGYVVYGDNAESPPVKRAYPASLMSDYALELAAFADYVAGVQTGPTTGVSERRTLSIVQAGYESIASGAPIVLKDRFGDL